MEMLVSLAARPAMELKKRGATIAIAESSTGGLLSAALLAVPGASAYFLGGAVVYTGQARRVLLGVTEEALVGIRSATEAYALLMARTVRQQFSSVWGLAETGATGPAGNRYGDPAGHACIAVAGPLERVVTIETGVADRLANMRAFTEAAVALLVRAIEEAALPAP